MEKARSRTRNASGALCFGQRVDDHRHHGFFRSDALCLILRREIVAQPLWRTLDNGVNDGGQILVHGQIHA